MAHSPAAIPKDAATVYRNRSSFEDVGEGAPMLLSAGQTPYHHASVREDEERLEDEKGSENTLPMHCLSGLHRRMNYRRFILILFPSFIARRFGYHSDVKPSRPNETSYLNGLRGIAALIVVIHHSSLEFYPENHGCYGDAPPELDHYIKLPFLRLVHNGSFTVAVFFVISGFSLAYGPLRKIHAGNAEAAVAGMPSSIFRRPIRLFLPLLPIFMLAWILIQLGLVMNLNSVTPIDPRPNIFLEAWYGFQSVIVFDAVQPPFLAQGWTLPAEYRGSLLLFLCCLAFARTSTSVRVIGVSAVAAHLFHEGDWVGFLFLTGMLLAELRHARAKRPALRPAYRWMLSIGSALLLFPALLFASWPYRGIPSQCVGFRHFAHIHTTGLMEQHHFFHALGSPALILVLENLPSLRPIFNTSFVLYLGDISYSLYLVHGMFVIGLSKRVALAMLSMGYSRLTACLGSVGFTIFVGVWLADLLWRISDTRSVKFAWWAAKRIGI